MPVGSSCSEFSFSGRRLLHCMQALSVQAHTYATPLWYTFRTELANSQYSRGGRRWSTLIQESPSPDYKASVGHNRGLQLPPCVSEELSLKEKKWTCQQLQSNLLPICNCTISVLIPLPFLLKCVLFQRRRREPLCWGRSSSQRTTGRGATGFTSFTSTLSVRTVESPR